MLRLLLNSLYAVSRDLYPKDLIKGAFEMRVATLSGYAPDLEGCSRCGEVSAETTYLDVMNGSLRCGECFGTEADTDSRIGAATATVILPLSPSVLHGMRYVIGAPAKRVFSFTLPEEAQTDFCRVCEKYLVNQLERSFRTLEFYHNIRRMG